MSDRDDIYSALESWDLDLPQDLDDRTALFDSGLFDSLALFNLVVWVETRVGRPVDPSQFDLRREWGTIGDIVAFVEKGQGRDAEHDEHDPAPAPSPLPRDDYRVEMYRPEFKAQVASLQTGLWSPDVERNTRYFEWKYERNPYSGGTPHLYLLFFRDELVGMRGFSESRWEVGSRVEPVLIADDLVIRDDHRNRGLYTRIMDAVFADLTGRRFTHLFNLSASLVNVLGSLTMGWKSVGVLDPVGSASSGARLRTRCRSAIRKMPAVWRYAGSPVLYSRFEKAPFRDIDKHLTEGDRGGIAEPTFSKRPRIPEMVELIDRQSHDGRIRHLRDREYLSWRYENPLQDYRFVYSDGTRLNGYLAMSRSIAGHVPNGRVAIADIEARDDDTFDALLGAATREVRNLVVWPATMNEAKRSTLRNLGFAPIDRSRTSRGCPCILVRPLSESDDWSMDGMSLLDMNAWDVRMLYSMVA